MGNTQNVRVGSPKIGGYAFSAPLGTTPPPDATTALNAAYDDLGFISSEGVGVNPAVETEDIEDWGGDVVKVVTTSRGAQITTALIETTEVVLAEIYGEDNVTVVGDKIHIKFTGEPLPHKQYSFETKDGDQAGRLVINDGQIITPGGGERTLTRTALRQYALTIKCFRDSSGAFFHEYFDNEA